MDRMFHSVYIERTGAQTILHRSWMVDRKVGQIVKCGISGQVELGELGPNNMEMQVRILARHLQRQERALRRYARWWSA